MNRDGELRSEPGSYALLLELAQPVSLSIGGLGRHPFDSGRYVYAGSALGLGGVAGRLSRHLRAGKRIHWHVDYLIAAARVIGASATYSPDRLECLWAHALQALNGATAPVAHFGSSDCHAGCYAHLWRLPDNLSLSWIEDELTGCPIRTI